MTTFFSYIKKHKIPSFESFKAISPRTWQGLLLYTLVVTTLVVGYVFIVRSIDHFLVEIPARGGSLTEGVIGAPRFLNPVLASTETDASLTKLLFSGLVKAHTDGTYSPELADHYEVSADGKTYTFTLRDNLRWSDRKPLTSADVAFTVTKLKNPLLNQTSDWSNITVSTPDIKTIIVTTSGNPDEILEKMSTGITPEHVWSEIDDDVFEFAPQNLHPVGSGPFTYTDLSSRDGIPTKISLKRNKHYALAAPYLDEYSISFFANQTELADAISRGSIDLTLSATPESVRKDAGSIPSTTTITLLHTRADTFFASAAFVDILNASIDKNAILATVDNGYGILSPVEHRDDAAAALTTLGYNTTDGTLVKNGAQVGFSMAVENDPTLLAVARTLAAEFGRLGILVDIRAFDRGIFNDGVDRNEYPIILATTAPSQYAQVFPLYTKAFPFIKTSDSTTELPTPLDSITNRYEKITTWHTRTNRVWNIFSKHNE